MKKTVLVTGATRGLGLQIATDLAHSGYFVVGTGRADSDGTRQLTDNFPEAFAFESCDFHQTGGIRDFCGKLTGTYGRFYGLVNNAALGYDGILSTMHETEIDAVIRVNIESPILLSKYIGRSMLMNQEGRIINISSIIASTGFNGLSVYAASKSALQGFTRSLARELGKANITVNCVAPGYMETDMTTGLDEAKLESIVRRSPMRRLASPRDVAETVGFLLSDKAASITGTTITVDAGSTA